MIRPLLAASVLAAFTASFGAQAATTRTHVSNNGNDANTSFSCDYAHPCRTFAAALTQTTAGGEILAIDSSGYGKLVIDRSVSIIAAPGVFAGIGVGASGNATGIEIATAGVEVVLRGLSLTGQGGTYGINMTSGTSLSVENCVLSGFSAVGAAGLRVSTAANIRIVDSLLRANYRGLWADGGATVSVAGARFLGNSWVGIANYATAGTTTSVTVSDSVVSGSTFGITAESNNSGHTRLSVIRSTVSNSPNYGLLAYTGSTGSSSLAVSDSLVSGNGTGLYQYGGNATLRSLGNNTVVDNTTPTSGTITAQPAM